MMPVMDGIELCSRLKKNIQTSHIPIILLTAKNMVESWIEGLETGADDYIPKPFNLQILEIKMRNIIESRRKIKNTFSSPEPIAPEKLASNKLDEEFITKAYQVLEKNYNEPNFSVEQFAREMFVSRSLLYKKIKALTNLNITDFINSYKLKKSVELIKSTELSISEIAFKTGFNDPKYFSRIFKKFYGTSPSDYLKKT
jgi:YesN/AraC family two-component response regulator